MKNNVAFKIINGAAGILPTDTLYGLVGSAMRPDVVEKIYQLKQRDQNKPFIILIERIEDLARFDIEIDEQKLTAIKKYWPGPVSLVFPCHSEKFKYLHRGTESLAFRMPKRDDLTALLHKTGPLVAPSANPEGNPPATTIKQAKKYFKDSVDFYIDDGTLAEKPSKIIKITDRGEEVLRSQLSYGILK